MDTPSAWSLLGRRRTGTSFDYMFAMTRPKKAAALLVPDRGAGRAIATLCVRHRERTRLPTLAANRMVENRLVQVFRRDLRDEVGKRSRRRLSDRKHAAFNGHLDRPTVL